MRTAKLMFLLLLSLVLQEGVAGPKFIAMSFANVSTGPGEGYPVTYVVERGEKVEVLKQKTYWAKIKTQNNTTGWVNLNSFSTIRSFEQVIKLENMFNAKWEIGASMGVLGAESNVSASIGRYILRPIALTAQYEKAIGDYSSSSVSSVNLMLQVFRSAMFYPFASFGYGVMTNTPRTLLVNAGQTEQAVFTYSGGLNYVYDKRMLIRFSYGNYRLSDLGENLTQWKIGFYGLFR